MKKWQRTEKGWNTDIPPGLREHLRNRETLPIPDADRMLHRIRAEIERTPQQTCGRIIPFPSGYTKAAALLLIFVGVFWIATQQIGRYGNEKVAESSVLWVETFVPDSSAMVYQDEGTGLTVIWMIEDESMTQGTSNET